MTVADFHRSTADLASASTPVGLASQEFVEATAAAVAQSIAVLRGPLTNPR
jgi:hypothetical protein